MKKILLVGGGSREHIIGEKLKASGDAALYVVAPNKNMGLMNLAEEYCFAEVDDVESIVAFAKEHEVDFAVMGPELPLFAGVVDALDEVGIKSASPLKKAAQIETSKGFTRMLLDKYGIPGNPKFKVFKDDNGLAEWLQELGENYVIKADGLKGGKGVMVSGDHLNGFEEGYAYAMECLNDSGQVVVEEKLVGQEFSLLFFCDGHHLVPMPMAQDHKRAFEGDLGANTGGMGSYSVGAVLPFLEDSDLEMASEMTIRVVDAIYQETGVKYKGVIYGGFMAVKDGVRLIEYNARFGDPEVMNVLSLLYSDLVEVCEAIIEGRLDEMDVFFRNKATVCKYVVPSWYPDGVRGDLDDRVWMDFSDGDNDSFGDLTLQIYLGSITEEDGELKMLGSRAIAFVGIADTLEEAENIAERGAMMTKGNVRHRRDIGTAGSIEKKTEMMRRIRG